MEVAKVKEWSFKLTEEQKKIIKKATGEAPDELLVKELEISGVKMKPPASLGVIVFGRGPEPRYKGLKKGS